MISWISRFVRSLFRFVIRLLGLARLFFFCFYGVIVLEESVGWMMVFFVKLFPMSTSMLIFVFGFRGGREQ